jgi:predicted aspartyl protease
MLALSTVRRLLLVPWASMIAFGCVGETKCPVAPVERAIDAPAAVIFYTPDSITARSPLPSPLVHGKLAGRPTLMLVDTGAQVSLVTAWFAREAGLEPTEEVAGRGADGRGVPMHVNRRPQMVIDGWGAMPERPVAIAELPGDYQKLGIGVILSPQSFATENESVVLDLRKGEMRRMPPGRARAELPSSAAVIPGTRLCAYRHTDLNARALGAKAIIDGVSVDVELDTGASKVLIQEDSALGRGLLPRAEGTSGKGLALAGTYVASMVPSISVSLGAWETKTEVAVAGTGRSACGYQARLGMDHLRSCTFVIGAADLHVACMH